MTDSAPRNGGEVGARLILASSSPRRAELLRQLGLAFGVESPCVDEGVLPGEPARDYVERMATGKARNVLARRNAGPALVIGSDTAVIVDGTILGKPRDFDDFRQTMALLSGRKHQVMSAVAVADAEKLRSVMQVSEVAFRVVRESEIDAYWRTGEPLDKAGGYAIQGYGAAFIASLHGSYSGVMGLPLFETVELLAEFGVDLW